MKEAILFTEEYLEGFFEDNAIEDDQLFDFLRGREGSIEMSDKKEFDNEKDEETTMIIKIKEFPM